MTRRSAQQFHRRCRHTSVRSHPSGHSQHPIRRPPWRERHSQHPWGHRPEHTSWQPEQHNCWPSGRKLEHIWQRSERHSQHPWGHRQEHTSWQPEHNSSLFSEHSSWACSTAESASRSSAETCASWIRKAAGWSACNNEVDMWALPHTSSRRHTYHPTRRGQRQRWCSTRAVR